MQSSLHALLDPVLDLIYPPRCAACGQGSESPLCGRCLDAISPVPPPLCSCCGQSTAGRDLCSHCAYRIPAFTAARALGAYAGVLEQAIHRLKYRDRPQLAEPLGIALAEFARTHASALSLAEVDFIAPAPMSPARRRVRGYNQAERLARVVARELGIPLDTTCLRRVKSARPQVGLTQEARQQNLTGVFSVSNNETVAGKTILIVDDVSTTGATLDECARVLKAAEAKAVYALTLAAG